MLCPADVIRKLRDPFMWDVHQSLRQNRRAIGMTSPLPFLVAAWSDECTLERTTQFIYDIFQCCDAVPLLVITSAEQLRSYATL